MDHTVDTGMSRHVDVMLGIMHVVNTGVILYADVIGKDGDGEDEIIFPSSH